MRFDDGRVLKPGLLHDLIQNWIDAPWPEGRKWVELIEAHCELKGGEVFFTDNECHLDPPGRGWGYVYRKGETP